MASLVLGATGFVGRALVDALTEAGEDVRAAARQPRARRPGGRGPPDARAAPAAECARMTCDLRDPWTLDRAPRRSRLRLLPRPQHGRSPGRLPPRRAPVRGELRSRRRVERVPANRLPRRRRPARIVSEHLASRLEVGETLRSGRVRTLELRAAMIIGDGSVSFRIVRDLAARLPLMILPRWLDSRSRPIAIADVIGALLDGPPGAARGEPVVRHPGSRGPLGPRGPSARGRAPRQEHPDAPGAAADAAPVGDVAEARDRSGLRGRSRARARPGRRPLAARRAVLEADGARDAAAVRRGGRARARRRGPARPGRRGHEPFARLASGSALRRSPSALGAEDHRAGRPRATPAPRRPAAAPRTRSPARGRSTSPTRTTRWVSAPSGSTATTSPGASAPRSPAGAQRTCSGRTPSSSRCRAAGPPVAGRGRDRRRARRRRRAPAGGSSRGEPRNVADERGRRALVDLARRADLHDRAPPA